MRLPDREAVAERWAALRDPAVRAELEADCRAAVVEEVWHSAHSHDHLPGPYRQQTFSRVPARRRSGPPGVRIGLDAHGRPVIATEDDVLGPTLLRWTPGAVEVRFSGSGALEVHTLDDTGRSTCAVMASPGRGDTAVIDTIYYIYDDAGRPEREIRLHRSYSDPDAWGARLTLFAHDARGDLTRVDLEVVDAFAHGDDEDTARAAAIAHVLPDDPERVAVWDARRFAREDDLPEPAAALDGLAEPLARGIRDAARATVGDVAFVAVRLLPWGEDRRPIVYAAAASVAGRERIRRAGAADAAAVAGLAYARSAETGPIDVLAHADDDLVRRLRVANQALADDFGERARRITAFAPALAAALGDLGVVFPDPDEAPLPGAALASLTPIAVDASAAEPLPDVVARLLEDAGIERVDEALAGSWGSAPRELRVPSRDVLAALLEAVGLTPDDAATVAADARWALVLAEDPDGSSRIGGLPILPQDVPWPTAGGRALTHLATLACDTLPDAERRDLLPADGHLALFADLTQEGELFEPVEPGSDRRDLVRIVHTPAGAPSHSPDPGTAAATGRDEHDSPAVLGERRVRAVPRLQLRRVGFGMTNTLWSIDELHERSIERLLPAVNGDDLPQLLGSPSVVQEDPRVYDDDADEILFHLGWDESIGFCFLDGGDLTFYGPPAALRAGDWDQVTVSAGSC